MSQAVPSRSRSAARPNRAAVPSRPVLEVVEPAAARATGARVALGAISVLLVLLLTPMAIHAQMAVSAFEMHRQEVLRVQLEQENAEMKAKLAAISSPTALDQAAREAGMVPAARTGYLSLGAGTVTAGEAAQAAPVPTPTPTTPGASAPPTPTPAAAVGVAGSEGAGGAGANPTQGGGQPAAGSAPAPAPASSR